MILYSFCSANYTVHFYSYFVYSYLVSYTLSCDILFCTRITLQNIITFNEGLSSYDQLATNLNVRSIYVIVITLRVVR